MVEGEGGNPRAKVLDRAVARKEDAEAAVVVRMEGWGLYGTPWARPEVIRMPWKEFSRLIVVGEMSDSL